ncbi:ATP-grasp domain-containing protein [Clostridium sp. ZS2-4]|uniref:ATP-grasp domain-containing protein n=1 Tax=Clostridium sp. ZS2-4 TaxID=2987703 RepID=UPI00227C3A72|nr:ATP-grasp domain-containing protein [Clostridium sp. ZS2-4]MCY6355336.1 ATP-grasp domain-containing protein [Clostridium sp. ZS2-4]
MKKRVILFDHNSKLNYTLNEVLALNVEVFCINNQNNIQKNKECNVFYVDYLNNPKEALEQLIKLNEEYKFDGILCFAEQALCFVSELCKTLNLNFVSKKAIKTTRNKSLLKEQFILNGVKTSQYLAINTEKDIDENTLEKVSFPLVVKPSSGMGSMGVIRVDDYQSLVKAVKTVREFNEKNIDSLNRSNQIVDGKIIIEEYIDGKEYAVETFTVNGEVFILSIGYKGYPIGPYFEESIYLAPAQLESNIINKMKENVRKAVLAANIKNGPAHVELRVNASGDSYILEIGARIGGSGVSHFIVKETTGINFIELCLKLSLGEIIDKELNVNQMSFACNYIIQIGEGGNLESIEGLDEVTKYEDTYEVILMDCIGKDYYPYPKGAFFNGYPGFVFSRHDSYKKAVDYFEFLDKTLKLKFKPFS